jgi:hypothetical protein
VKKDCKDCGWVSLDEEKCLNSRVIRASDGKIVSVEEARTKPPCGKEGHLFQEIFP